MLYKKVFLILVTILTVSSCGLKRSSASLNANGYAKNEQDSVHKKVSQEKDDKVLYFAYDSSKIDSDSANYLDKKVVLWLKNQSDIKVVIQGHCDERGSNSYNYVLGKKRAKSVMEYLADRGIAKSRMKVVSYGKSRPFSAGHNEESWSLNRRVVILSTQL